MRTDEETGRDIWDKHQGNTPQFNPSHADWYAALTRAAREVLAQERAETTEEAVRDWVKSKINYENKIGSALLAAIRHFAPPAQPVPECVGWTSDQLWDAFVVEAFDIDHRGNTIKVIPLDEVERIAYSLLHPQPQPAPDRDAEAKEQAFIWHKAVHMPGHDKPQQYWDCINDDEKDEWRAVARAKGPDNAA